MAKKVCVVENCNNPAHAKGYCRKHYGQIWRKGRINPEEQDDFGADDDDASAHDDSDRMRALERELRKAQHMYQQVVGFEGRLKWRKEMEAVKKEIDRLTGAEAETEAEAVGAGR
ncbi:MAG: hypothetical protein ACOCX4_04710 [Planctomycetota bacterium]